MALRVILLENQRLILSLLFGRKAALRSHEIPSRILLDGCYEAYIDIHALGAGAALGYPTILTTVIWHDYGRIKTSSRDLPALVVLFRQNYWHWRHDVLTIITFGMRLFKLLDRFSLIH